MTASSAPVLGVIALLSGCSLLFEPAPEPRPGGDVLYMPFGDDDQLRIVSDRSGQRFDAYRGPALSAVEGRFGEGLLFNGADASYLRIPDHPKLYLGSSLTIEMWLQLEAGTDEGLLFGDHDLDDDGAPVEITMAITGDDVLELLVSDGCSGEVVEAFSSVVVPEETWVHVAATWDGEEARFYLDGSLADVVPLVATPCESKGLRPYFVGRRGDGGASFHGTLDELRVSSFVKNEREIALSMLHDSSLDVGACGDRLIDGEACDSDTPCCNPATCVLDAAGSPCGEGGSCLTRGVCEVEPGRAADGLIALYHFDEGTGATVFDRSGVEPALDLTIDPIQSVTWGDGFLTVDAPAKISSGVAATKISAAAIASNELTVEAWVAAKNLDQDGPARVATLSPNTSTRNMTLGQIGDRWITRFQTTVTNVQGQPAAVTPPGDLVTGLSHVVFTRSVDGERRIYVDGILRSTSTSAGDLEEWRDYPLTLADEATGERAWLGELHLVAFYGRALGALEVQQSYLAGP